MRALSLTIALAVARAVSGQLLLPEMLDALRDKNGAGSSSSSSAYSARFRDGLQTPLGAPDGVERHSTGAGAGLGDSHVDLPDFEAGRATALPQNETTCATYGEKQWAGTVDISDERRLFYWFFDSRGDPEKDPIIIWLNGYVESYKFSLSMRLQCINQTWLFHTAAPELPP
jgi:hypothetical protein